MQEHNETCCSTCQPEEQAGKPEAANHIIRHWRPLISFLVLLTGLTLDYLVSVPWFTGNLRLVWYLAGYLPVALPVLRQAYVLLLKGDVFTEFFLMGIATLGAFYIGEYPEGVAVMLFYSVGEAFQHGAVQKARANIKALLDVRPVIAHVERGHTWSTIHPQSVNIGETIRVKPGERVPLDGKLLTARTAFDTSALTGESKPRHFEKGQNIPAGMINLNRVIELEVTKSFENSTVSRILSLVQDAASRKARTELFIRTFARVYTPAVVLLAVLLIGLPYFFITPYVFEDWLYRGLVFLVISCPCALVISIPLGYFGGIGAASRNGILVKGGNYLDALKSVETVVFDKTGTLTQGQFAVRECNLNGYSDDEILPLILAVEKGSTHPIAKAIIEYCGNRFNTVPTIESQKEVPGFGVQARVEGKDVLIGNRKLMNREQIQMNGQPGSNFESVVHIAIDRQYAGYLVIDDEIKEDAPVAIRRLREAGVKYTAMLSGDQYAEAHKVGELLKIDQVYAELLPEDKARKLEEIMQTSQGKTAYAGDGINDAPVLALSDVGIAMGAMGSDAAIETADVVIQTDQPSKIATAISIAKSTRNIVWQNIGLAMGIKLLFLSLGALGMASLWEAVFADVGVALLAVLNAIRIQHMHFD